MAMKSTCSHCGTVYRLDPRKVPAGGVRARCSVCEGVFEVTAPQPGAEAAPEHPRASSAAPTAPVPPTTPAPPATGPGASAAAAAAPAAEPPQRPAERGGISFGADDPQGKARRLARALVSDIAVYHPERRERAVQQGTLRQEFRDEIRKSWEEYVTQVGDATARGTPYFREALNEILAGGSPVF